MQLTLHILELLKNKSSSYFNSKISFSFRYVFVLKYQHFLFRRKMDIFHRYIYFSIFEKHRLKKNDALNKAILCTKIPRIALKEKSFSLISLMWSQQGDE